MLRALSKTKILSTPYLGVMRMNHHNAVASVYQQSKVQSETLRSFTLISLCDGEVVLSASTSKQLLAASVLYLVGES